MDGGEAAGVAGVPGLQQVQRLATTHLSNHDAVGP